MKVSENQYTNIKELMKSKPDKKVIKDHPEWRENIYSARKSLRIDAIRDVLIVLYVLDEKDNNYKAEQYVKRYTLVSSEMERHFNKYV